MGQANWIGYELGGRYRIDEQLGQGGMASVYKATDPNLRRAVAVKLIHPHLSKNPEFVRRFEEEAAAVAQLSHSNIIKVFDYNHDQDVYYMVLEFLPGETLQERLKRLNAEARRLSLNEVIRFGAEISDAVDYAHRRGMLHRDIKPANIMLNTDGGAVLMDFGVVKMLGGEQHTATGAVVGTAMYMAPEQARGERPDERSDIYALGVTLFEMVSGRRPFEADSVMTVLMMQLNDPVPNIQDIAPGTPLAIRQIIEKAMAKKADERFQTAGEMAAALRNVSGLAAGAAADATLLEPPTAPAFSPEATFLEAPSQAPEATFMEPPTAPAYGGVTREAPRAERPAPAGSAAPPKKGGGGLPLLAILGGGGLLAVLALIVVALLVLPGLLSGGGEGGAEPEAEGTDAAGVVVPTATDAPTDPPPTDAPSATPEPTATPYPEPYVVIESITLDGATYVVTYETYGYTEVLPGQHVHFFFNTVAPDQAGSPGGGPWIVWGGPRPFTVYGTGDKPAGATQMCALVANPNHSIQLNTGNCVDLPG